MRTLVLGIPLPHVSFDNYSFLSAPSLFDYGRVIVETASLSEAVAQVVSGSTEHKTHGGLAIVNGPATATAFSLAELVRLRCLEAERLLARAGVIVCFAHPDVPHEGIAGLPSWRRYDWLPAPEGFAYAEAMLAGYGKLGVELTDAEHAFVPYVEEFAVRLAFRAYLSEAGQGPPPHASVFARSPPPPRRAGVGGGRGPAAPGPPPPPGGGGGGGPAGRTASRTGCVRRLRER